MSYKPATFLPYSRQNIDDDDKQAVWDALGDDFLTTGPKVEEFEQALCEATGSQYAVACGNGSLALHLAVLTLDFQPGDAAIVPSLTFLATANAVRYCGADVIFGDVDPETGLMGVEDFEKALNEAQKKNLKVKAVLPVHLGGQCADVKAIHEIADAQNIAVIADGAHCLGAECYGENVGALPYTLMTTYSFHPVKTIATGEGGAIATNDKKLADKMRLLRSHAMEKRPNVGPWAYDMNDLGYNYRISDIQCALGLSQLKKVDDFIERRRELAGLYDSLLEPMAPEILTPKRAEYSNSAWHLYAPRFDFEALGITRAQLMEQLKERGIGTQVHYIPVHTQPYYKKLYGEIVLPGAEQYYSQILSLPLYPALSDDDVHYVVQTLKGILGK